MDNQCNLFPNCKTLASRFGVNTKTLYTYIRTYNNYASRNNLEQVRNTRDYSDDELNKIYENIFEYRQKREFDKKFNESERKKLAESYGSFESYATSIIQNSSLSGKEIDEIVSEITRLFVNIITITANNNNYEVDELMSKLPLQEVFDSIRNTFLSNAYGSDSTLTEDQKAEAQDLIRKFLPAQNGMGPDYFNELCILSLPYINCAFSVKINSDFTVSKRVDVDDETYVKISDDENKLHERWNSSVDTRPASGSVSSIVRRILLNTPLKERKVVKKYYLNGKEIDIDNFITDNKKDIDKIVEDYSVEYVPVNGTITGLPRFSNPDQLLRELFDMMENITSENDMMEALKKDPKYSSLNDSNAEYPSLYEYLLMNPRDRTTFYADLNKYFQDLYAVNITKNSDGTMSVKSPILNRGTKDNRLNDYFQNIAQGKVSNSSIFIKSRQKIKTNDGAFITTRKQETIISYAKFSFAKNWFKNNFIEKQDNGLTKFESLISGKETDYTTARNMLATVFDSFNINVSDSVINDILSDVSKLNEVIENLNNMFNLFPEETNLIPRSFNSVRNNNQFRTSLNNILKYTEISDLMTKRSIGMVRFGDSSISSRIQPSAISNFIRKAKAYDAESLSKWFEDRYLDSSQYRSNGTILNRWMRDLLKCAELKRQNSNDNISIKGFSFQDYFSLARNVGINNINFEDISDIQHLQMFIFSYLNNRNSGKSLYCEEKNNTFYKYNDNTGLYDIPVKNDELKSVTVNIVNDIISYKFDSRGGKTKSFRGDKAMVPLFITGDTNSLRLFTTINYSEQEIIDGLYDLYISDIQSQNGIKSLDNKGIVVCSNGNESLTKSGNSSKFGILGFLNSEKYSKLLKDELDRLNEKAKDEKIRKTVVSKEFFVKNIAKPYLEESFNSFIEDQVKPSGLLDVTYDKKTDSNKHVYLNNVLSDRKEDDTEENAINLLKEFFYNYKFCSYTQTQLFHVTGSSFNSSEEYQKRNKVVATNGTSLSQDAMIGDKQLFPDNFSQKVVYFKDVKGAMAEETKKVLYNHLVEEYTKELEIKHKNGLLKTSSQDPREIEKEINSIASQRAYDFVKDFNKNTLTDGEAYRILSSYRKIAGSAGKVFWTDEMEELYDTVSQISQRILSENRNATDEELNILFEFSTAIQPIKPVNDGIETFGSGDSAIKIGFQFKYAEVPLIPAMYPVGSKLREIGQWMEDNSVDMLCSDKCLKKGSFLELDVQYQAVDGKYIDANNKPIPGINQAGKIVDEPTMAEQRRYIESLGKNAEDPRVEYGDSISFSNIVNNHSRKDGKLNYYIHEIPLDNYLIQINIPDHTNGKVIFGTQPRKIVGSSIFKDQKYTMNINGEDVTVGGDKLFQIYGQLHSTKYFKSYVKFLNLINDNKKLTKRLANIISTNGRSNLEYLNRIALDENGEPIIPYSELSNNDEITSAILGMFKNGVLRQEINGGNIVQASSMGVGDKALQDPSLEAVIKDNVLISTKAEMPFDFSIKTEDGTIKLDYDTYCNVDGTFKVDEDGNTLIEKKYPGILDIVAYRIPTEGLYSMYNIHIARVTPKFSANTIKLPAECTTISGFDFDIDKLMFMRRTYRYETKEIEWTDREKKHIDSHIWKVIYDDRSDIYEALNAARDAASEEDLKKLAADYNTTVDKLRLNYFWNLADIPDTKQNVWEDYSYEWYYKDEPVGSTFKMGSQGGELMDLSEDAIDNAIVDITQAVLGHKSTMTARYTSGDFKMMKNAGRVMRCIKHLKDIGIDPSTIKTEKEFNELVEKIKKNKKLDFKEERDISDPVTALVYKQQNQIAGQDIGIFANNKSNEAIFTALKEYRIKNASDAILFGSLLSDNVVTDLGKENNNLLGLSFLFKSVNGVRCGKLASEFIDASVDAVKDNALIDLNLNEITSDPAAMLARMGYSAEDIGLLFNQPIIIDLCTEMLRSGEKNCTKALNRVMAKYTDIEDALSKPADTRYLTSYNLFNGLVNGDKNVQLNVARLFNNIMLQKQEFSDHIRRTRYTSANSLKLDIGAYLSNKDKEDVRRASGFKKTVMVANDKLADPITRDAIDERWSEKSPKEVEKLIRDFLDRYPEHPFLYEDAVHQIVDSGMDIILKKFTPFFTDIYVAYRNELKKYIAPWGLSGETINKLNNFIPGIITTGFNGDFNPSSTNNPLGIPNIKYYLRSFKDLVLEFDPEEYPDIANNDLIDSLSEEDLGTADGDVKLKLKYASKYLSSLEKYGITTGWDSLMKQGGPYADFAKALYLCSFYTYGLDPSTNPFMSKAPTSVLESLVVDSDTDLSYLDIYKSNNVSNISEETIRKNVITFIINNSKDPKFVPVMPFTKDVVSTSIDQDVIRISGKKNLDYITLSKNKNNINVSPIIRVDGILYILANKNVDGTFSMQNDVQNTVSKQTPGVYYIRLTRDQLEESKEFNKFINDNNRYIYNSIEESIIDNSDEFDDSDTQDGYSNEDEDDFTAFDEREESDSITAANEAATMPTEPDSTGVYPCDN